jgi:F-type H+-transporting ATPase subunit epsilon
MTTRVTVLAGVAERAEDIDVERARQAQERAGERVASLEQAQPSGRSGAEQEGEPENLDLQQARQALARAELRVAVATEAAA